MIVSALISFLGGSAFRMVWGEVSAYFTRRQEHQQELERMKASDDLERGRHERDLERIRLQSDLKVEEVKIVGDLAIQKTDADGFVEAMKNAFKPIGIVWVDAWNGSVRPAAASIALCLWVLALAKQGFIVNDWDRELIGAILGFYFADRALARRGR